MQTHHTFIPKYVARETLALETALAVDTLLLTTVRPLYTLINVITVDVVTAEAITVRTVTFVGARQVDAQIGAVLLRTLVNVHTSV